MQNCSKKTVFVYDKKQIKWLLVKQCRTLHRIIPCAWWESEMSWVHQCSQPVTITQNLTICYTETKHNFHYDKNTVSNWLYILCLCVVKFCIHINISNCDSDVFIIPKCVVQSTTTIIVTMTKDVRFKCHSNLNWQLEKWSTLAHKTLSINPKSTR